LASCSFDVTDSKPKDSTFPKIIHTLGDHLRARRMEKDLKQSDVSKILQVSKATITNWENNLTKPKTRYIPAIIRFLGYNPFPVPVKVFSTQIKYCRQIKGLTQEQMVKLLSR
jgi:transcriptional regulator with XRE-family HTH domain